MPTADIHWRDQTAELGCLVCGYAGVGAHIADVTALGQVDLPVVRCPDCGSLRMYGPTTDPTPDDAAIDAYLEGGAGIETIALGLAQVDPRSVHRFLDVGCNYGFGLDLARFRYGWEVVGVEPSPAGLRGAAELGLDIRAEYLTDETDLGGPFDLVLASEVVEHVTEPGAFLAMLRNRLTPTGTLVLTTPAAEVVDPAEPVNDAIVALSPGFHAFLASARGLEHLLRRAGFTGVSVQRDGGTLRARATLGALPIAAAGGPEADDLAALTRYYDDRAERAPGGSALANGMASRHLRSVVNRGDFERATDSAARAIDAMLRRHGLDLRHPAQVQQQLVDGAAPAWNLAGLAYALGMRELLDRGHPDRAHAYFDLTLTAVDAWRELIGLPDADLLDLRLHAARHRALAVARYLPEHAAAALDDLTTVARSQGRDRDQLLPSTRVRAFAELVAAGHYPAADELAERVAGSAVSLALDADQDLRRTGLDGLFSLGMLALQTGRPDEARRWLALCRYFGHRAGRPQASLDELLTAVADTDRIAADRGGRAPRLDDDADDEAVRYGLDVYWADTAGTYLQGWAHAGPEPASAITVRRGDRTATQAPADRPDLTSFWPEYPHIGAAGFGLHLAGAPDGPVRLELTTPSGPRAVTMRLPDRALPAGPPSVGDDLALGELVGQLMVAGIPPGPVLAIGYRSVEARGLDDLRELCAPRPVFCLDIHPGIGVDVVGDAHRLSSYFRGSPFALVLSCMLLEHVAAPWLVAAEVSRVLMPGGYTVQVAPSAWPEHAQPNDFWRYTTGALAELFGPATGLEVCRTGTSGTVRVVPDADLRVHHPMMAVMPTAAVSWIVSRKVAALDAAAVRWPYEPRERERRAREYPVDGLAGAARHPAVAQ